MGAEFQRALRGAVVASWILISLGGALVHVPILVLLSPLVWAAALVAFALVFRFLPPAREGRLGHLVSLATFGLGAVAILAASVFTGSVAGDAIDAARKQAHGLQVAPGKPLAAAVAMLLASAVLAAGVWLRTRWPMARISAVGAVYATGFAGVAMIQSVLPLNA